jgi:hypothetical protein
LYNKYSVASGTDVLNLVYHDGNNNVCLFM